MAKKNLNVGGGSDSTKVQKKSLKSVKKRASTIGAIEGIGGSIGAKVGPMQQAVKQRKYKK